MPGSVRPPAGPCPAGTSLEPRAHGAASPVSHIREVIADVLAAVRAVDLARAHQARLEALLGAPLPASLVEEGKPSLGT